MEETILDEIKLEDVVKENNRRRQLLPWWIKIGCWFFMLFGVMAFVCLFLGFANIQTSLAFYDFETTDPISFNGLLIIFVGLFKGITAYALWFEKDFAIKIGKIDAIIGIVLCTVSMLVLPFLKDGFYITFRLELALLIPFLLKMNKIQQQWEEQQ